MAEFYTNLPPKERDELQKTIDTLTTNNYETEYQFNVGEYDSTIAFFVNRGFKRASAESIAYVIMSQAKIDNIKPQQILAMVFWPWLCLGKKKQSHLILKLSN